MRATLIAILGFGPLLAVGAEVHRWVDEDGNVHFSDTRPASSPSEKIRIDTPNHGSLHSQEAHPPAEPAAQEPYGWISSDVQPPESEDPGQQPDSNGCKRAQIDWGILNEEMPVYVTDQGEYRPAWHGDTYKGGRRYVPDSHREELILEAEEQIFRTCEDPDNIQIAYETYDEWVQSEFCKVAQAKYEMARQPRSRTPRGELEKIRQAMDDQCRN